MQEPKRTDLLNHLATKHNLTRYLEIGVQNPTQNFDKIICEHKVSVDPDSNAHATFCMTSDEFFENNNYGLIDVTIKDSRHQEFIDQRFDLIFIDGLHTAEQVKKDFENSLKVLSPNGFIVLHDCNPQEEEHTIVPRPTQTGNWHGNVFQFAWRLFKDKNFCTVNIDCGCGVYHGNTDPTIVLSDKFIEWVDFTNRRKELLRLIEWNDFINLNYANI